MCKVCQYFEVEDKLSEKTTDKRARYNRDLINKLSITLQLGKLPLCDKSYFMQT